MIKLRYTKKSGKLKGETNDSGIRYLEYMSYSRWITSKFYTYWSGNNVYSKEDEVFIVHHDLETFRGFTYSECKELIVDKMKLKGKMNFINNDEEADELQGYMKKFIGDVDHKYLTDIRGGQ